MSFPLVPFASKISVLRGLGAPRAAAFQEAGIESLRDLLWQLPFRYIDRGSVLPIGDLTLQHASISGSDRTTITVIGTVSQIKSIRTRSRLHILEITLHDDSGLIKIVFYNQPYLSRVFKEGEKILVYGPLTVNRSSLEFRVPSYEVLGNNTEDLWIRKILPLYRRIGPITSKIRSKLIAQALEIAVAPEELLPLELSRGLPDEKKALELLHIPPDHSDLVALNAKATPSHHRLIRQELFAFSLGVALRRVEQKRRRGQAIQTSEKLRQTLKEYLPFPLTQAQRRVFKEIADDLRSGHVMHRLLQGDVGSGKTLVAFMAMAMVGETGGQAALLVPTEILARQHARTFNQILGVHRDRLALLLGGMKTADKRSVVEKIRLGSVQYIIGTHALFQESVSFKGLQLIVVDEQHRFGVKQREALKDKGGDPHWLVMSATPIPRSLALALFGDLDHSEIDELPPGRLPVKTHLFSTQAMDQVWTMIEKTIKAKQQVFMVSPAIDAMEYGMYKLRDIHTLEGLVKKQFPEVVVAVIHGRLKADASEKIMTEFAQGRIQILIATTVIEVGVDIPNATLMIVDHAERFGLSQLHQLRGRIGRGDHAGNFAMVSDSPQERLKVLLVTQDGFSIAQADLRLRGQGDVFGTKQSGLPMFLIADVQRDQDVLTECRKIADAVVLKGVHENQRQWIRQELKHFGLADIS